MRCGETLDFVPIACVFDNPLAAAEETCWSAGFFGGFRYLDWTFRCPFLPEETDSSFGFGGCESLVDMAVSGSLSMTEGASNSRRRAR